MSKHQKKAKGDCCKEFKACCKKKGADCCPPGGATPPAPAKPANDEKSCPTKPAKKSGGHCPGGGCD